MPVHPKRSFKRGNDSHGIRRFFVLSGNVSTQALIFHRKPDAQRPFLYMGMTTCHSASLLSHKNKNSVPKHAFKSASARFFALKRRHYSSFNFPNPLAIPKIDWHTVSKGCRLSGCVRSAYHTFLCRIVILANGKSRSHDGKAVLRDEKRGTRRVGRAAFRGTARAGYVRCFLRGVVCAILRRLS